jgi:hypothetical protein
LGNFKGMEPEAPKNGIKRNHCKDFGLLLKRILYEERPTIRHIVDFVKNGGRDMSRNGWSFLVICMGIVVFLALIFEHEFWPGIKDFLSPSGQANSRNPSQQSFSDKHAADPSEEFSNNNGNENWDLNAFGEQMFTFPVSAPNSNWQPWVNNLPIGMKAVLSFNTLATNQWIVNPWFGFSSPIGYSNQMADKSHVYPYIPQGAMIVRDGNGNYLYWTNLSEKLTITNAGQISFIANDSLQTDANGQRSAYADNVGQITVVITVSSNRITNHAP